MNNHKHVRLLLPRLGASLTKIITQQSLDSHNVEKETWLFVGKYCKIVPWRTCWEDEGSVTVVSTVMWLMPMAMTVVMIWTQTISYWVFIMDQRLNQVSHVHDLASLSHPVIKLWPPFYRQAIWCWETSKQPRIVNVELRFWFKFV